MIYKSLHEILFYKYILPITVLSPISKVFEALVAAQIKFYFERLNSLGDSQNGLREKRSCESALNTMVDYWIKSHDFGESVFAVFIDISKAFDIVNHELLLINFV